jgi:cytochrome c oxidase assembly protein subunit 15
MAHGSGERLGNVLLGWPFAAAVAHTAGAAALVVVLTLLLARSAPAAFERASLGTHRTAAVA